MTDRAKSLEAMLDHVEGGYVNVPDRAIADFGASYYGANFDRLHAIKAEWDPHDVLHFEQSIPLSQGAADS